MVKYLKELLTLRYGKRQNEVESEKGLIPIYGTGGIFGYAIKPLYDKPSILIGRKGSINNPMYVKTPFWCVDTMFYSEINTYIVNPQYLYYNLSCIDFNKLDEGTTIPSLRIETLNSIQLSIHSLPVQQHITDIPSIYSSLFNISIIFVSSFLLLINNSFNSCLTLIISVLTSSSDILLLSSIPTYLPGTSE